MEDLRVIIVEDEYRIRQGLERLITSHPHCTVNGVYSNGQEAIDGWERTKAADVVLTDIKMPVMDGLTLIQSLKSAGYTGDYLVLSGFDDFEYVQQALRNKVNDYLLKPIDRKQLQKRLLELYEKKQEQQKQLISEKQKQEQLHVLRAISGESSLAGQQWTEMFPEGMYFTCQLFVLDFYQQKSKRDLVRFHQELSNVIRLLETELSAQWSDQDFWWWWDQERSFGLLVHTDNANSSELFEELAKTLSHRTFFQLIASAGQVLQDLELLPSALETEHIEMKLRPKIAEIGSTEAYSRSVQDDLSTLRFAFKQLLFEKLDSALTSLQKELSSLQQVERTAALLQSTGIEMLHDVSRRLPVTEVNNMLQRLGKHTSRSLSETELVQAFENWTRTLANLCIRSQKQSDQTAVERAKVFIQNHLQDSITIEQVAGHVYMNPTYFCAYFKKHTNETVLHYVTKQRLELAKQLLEDTDEKVAEVSEAVGYQDQKYFTKIFKKHTGFSPSEYRRTRR
ncbi:two component transcriptional regulator, AraC family [Terribacillus aidingensis]|uniref:Two component transcriptional regulator, AraC family n=1 Tax=Terribacillus aidingensis TaxID=586416 RepID=A0A285NMZ3_9BACI|nr:response regulator [Terribacillus aidingensis]SNZ10588.1 two component transcriptional regulator, AraC family [Terribacillus aidingensis]